MQKRTNTTDKGTAKPLAGADPQTVSEKNATKEPTASAGIPAPHISSKASHQGKPTDVQVAATTMYLLPLTTRMPLKFGAEVVTQVDCVRVCVAVRDSNGNEAEGWGETPLSVQWAWPSASGYESRLASMTEFCRRLVHAWPRFSASGHPLELGNDFLRDCLPELLSEHNSRQSGEPMPYLAALICASAFDIALHDAYGNLHDIDIYQTYNREFLNRDLASYLTPADDTSIAFHDQYPEDFFVSSPPQQLTAWHLVGGLDPLDPKDLDGQEPSDGYPVLLRDWIATDGLKCLKIKLRGNNKEWDYDRLVAVGKIALSSGVELLSADFNCCVQEPVYVNDILDRLRTEYPEISDMLIYVEQPFPYELEAHRIDVHSISERKPLFLDESAHDWQHVRLGRTLGWTGVALKTCKTQSGAILSLCWAKAHGMQIMVQDLTNPMLAQIPHVRLAAHAGTICGVETNAMQFYPAASAAEAKVHPGLYARQAGKLDLSTITGSGFGYRLDEMDRTLPAPTEMFSASTKS